MRFDNKTDAQIESWARKFEEACKTDLPEYELVLAERIRRRQKKHKLSFELSLEHLKMCAIAGKFTSYGQLAKASDVEWSQARHQMNGHDGLLDTLLGVCKNKKLPLLTAICVNQENLETGKLGVEALTGFVEGAKRIGWSVGDPEEFHLECVRHCFEWGEKQKS
ncbi:MAG: hypothetical protein CVT76_07830 [Alphaproteobacteria bacterium HGW-Alphaproteobacteria-15]|nr:MAG: hypothetical protein CVT76_07830 [Alphaproteobacteria bacterium HGW-Alphaproteobacteria-15]